MERFPDIELLFIESGGDNLSATFSPELVDATIFVIDVAEGDKIPRKGGPGITDQICLSSTKSTSHHMSEQVWKSWNVIQRKCVVTVHSSLPTSAGMKMWIK